VAVVEEGETVADTEAFFFFCFLFDSLVVVITVAVVFFAIVLDLDLVVDFVVVDQVLLLLFRNPCILSWS